MDTLYVTDLDGTLIRDDLSLSDWSRRTLVSLLEEGVALTVATARSIHSLGAILGDIPFRLPVVEFNGAFLTDYTTRRHRFVRAIEPGLARGVAREVAAMGMRFFLSTYDGGRDLLCYTGTGNDGEEAYVRERILLQDDRLTRVDDMEERLDQQVVCVTVIDKEARLVELQRRLSAAFGSGLEHSLYAFRYCPGWHFYSVHDARATKDQGIRELQAACGLSAARLVVFGDDVNDKAMFRIATRAIAVSNARDDVKALAHEVIGSNQEDGVLRWICADRACKK
jgi:5-amino-6-(5-phospho-D-ribitylamino)uracil phosphatase